MEQHDRLDYDNVVEVLSQQSGKAQVTFLFKLISKLGASACRTIIRYAYNRLDEINLQLSDDDPNKHRYIKMEREMHVFRERLIAK